MSEIYNKDYYEKYDVGIDEKVSYSNSEYTKDFLTKVAQQIVDDIHPNTVLDAGCAMGHLVASLRDLGVDAYGIDISEYAVNHAREDIRPFLTIGSLTEPLPVNFPQKFDLVTNIEVMEHLDEDDCIKAIEKLCGYTDHIIFSSTPDDIDDPTHLNVQLAEYWIKRFAKHGFFNKVEYKPNYISKAAMDLYRASNIEKVVENYERDRRICLQELNKLNDVYKPNEKTVSTVFFDVGQGFSSKQSISIITEGVQFYQEVLLPQGTLAVRFDPIEGKGCIVENLEIISNIGKLPYQNVNGYQLNNYEIFVNTDPQIMINLAHPGITCLKIKAEIFPIDQLSLIGLLSECSDLVKEREFTRQELLATVAKYNEELKFQRDQYKQQLQFQGKQYANKMSDMTAKIEFYNVHYPAAIGGRDAMEQKYFAISNSTFWKITKPFRVVVNGCKRIMKAIPLVRLVYKGLVSLRHYGFKSTRLKVKDYFNRRKKIKPVVINTILTEQERKLQSETIFSRKIKFSILVPLYNTPVDFLKEMMNSVIQQTYADWELCLADGSDDQFAYVESQCIQLANKDNRIKYKKLLHNEGIAGNTNHCIDMATGEYIVPFDHDDLMHPSALYEAVKAICEKNADFIYTDECTFKKNIGNAYNLHFKPDFSIDTLRSYNYICHLSIFSKELLDKAGHYRPECNGSQDYDMILRLVEHAKNVVHIPKILYFWRAHNASVASGVGAKPYVVNAAVTALTDHLVRVGLKGTVEESYPASTYKTNYEIVGEPLISIIIPNKDELETLRKCIDSIYKYSSYTNYEIVIVENHSEDLETFAYYEEVKLKDNVQVVIWKQEFNFSAINNYGVSFAHGEFLLLLNNDVSVISRNWLQEMLMYAQREDVGAVGAKLYYPDETIQHAGVILGIGGVAGHSHKYFDRYAYGYMSRLYIVQNLSCVTAACLMISKSKYESVDGFDEQYRVAFNDVDFCLRLRKAGFLNVFTPYAELYHYESKSRGYEDTPEKQMRFRNEIMSFQRKWHRELAAGDPFYNPNLSLEREDFSMKQMSKD